MSVRRGRSKATPMDRHSAAKNDLLMCRAIGVTTTSSAFPDRIMTTCHIGLKRRATKPSVSCVLSWSSAPRRLTQRPHPDVGKFLNGYSQVNYHIPPKGWDHVDALVFEPSFVCAMKARGSLETNSLNPISTTLTTSSCQRTGSAPSNTEASTAMMWFGSRRKRRDILVNLVHY